MAQSKILPAHYVGLEACTSLSIIASVIGGTKMEPTSTREIKK
jgi:hypothetical protein